MILSQPRFFHYDVYALIFCCELVMLVCLIQQRARPHGLVTSFFLLIIVFSLVLVFFSPFVMACVLCLETVDVVSHNVTKHMGLLLELIFLIIFQSALPLFCSFICHLR